MFIDYNDADDIKPISDKIRIIMFWHFILQFHRCLVMFLELLQLRDNLVFLSFIFQRNELSRELAPLLWNSFGTIAVLLQV